MSCEPKSKIIFVDMTLTYKNISVNYSVEGKGEAVVLLHGFLEDLTMWHTFIPELSKSHQIISIDLLGHGKTECLGYVHTMEDMADSVHAVLQHIEIEKAKFIGHSMGGYVALALVEKAPQLFKGLCLMNSTFEPDNEERKTLRTRSAKMAKTNYEALVRMSFSNLFAPKSKLKFQKDFEKGLEQALKTPVQGYIAAQEGMKLRQNRFRVFKEINGQKLIIVGKKDSLININSIENQIQNQPIDIKVLSGGHMSHIENKSELTYLFKHFIEK